MTRLLVITRLGGVVASTVKHSWLQSEDELQNPCEGKAMPGCGELRKMQ